MGLLHVFMFSDGLILSKLDSRNPPHESVITSWSPWLNAAAKLLTGFKTSNNIRPILPPLPPPADISINCNI